MEALPQLCSSRGFFLMVTLIRTRDIIAGWIQIPTKTYGLCSVQDESTPHLFFDCCISKEIWLSILQWIKLHRQCLNWDERNDRLFRSKSQAATRPVHNIKVNALLRSQSTLKSEFFEELIVFCVLV